MDSVRRTQDSLVARLRWHGSRGLGAVATFLLVWFGVVRVDSLLWPVLVIHRPDAPHSGDRVEAVDSLRVGAYNIAHGRGIARSNWDGGGPDAKMARLRAVAMLLASLDLDVVVLNEVDFSSTWSHRVNQARVIAEVAGFPYWVEQHNFDIGLPGFELHFGNAILSRHPIVAADRLVLPPHSWVQSVALGRKDAVLATIELPSAERIRVLGVHLAPRDESVRVASAQLMQEVARSSELPLVAAGDFNSSPLGFPAVETDAHGRSALSVLLEHDWSARPREMPAEEQFTFSAPRPRRVLDWVLTAPGMELLEQRSFPIVLSDHRPIVGVVRLPSSSVPGTLPTVTEDDPSTLAAGP